MGQVEDDNGSIARMAEERKEASTDTYYSYWCRCLIISCGKTSTKASSSALSPPRWSVKMGLGAGGELYRDVFGRHQSGADDNRTSMVKSTIKIRAMMDGAKETTQEPKRTQNAIRAASIEAEVGQTSDGRRAGSGRN